MPDAVLAEEQAGGVWGVGGVGVEGVSGVGAVRLAPEQVAGPLRRIVGEVFAGLQFACDDGAVGVGAACEQFAHEPDEFGLPEPGE